MNTDRHNRRLTDWQRTPLQRIRDSIRWAIKRDPQLTENVVFGLCAAVFLVAVVLARAYP